MTGEFNLRLKAYDQHIITKIFEDAYGRKLQAAYNKSSFAINANLEVSDFYAGYLTNDSLFLVYAKESTTLKVYVETINRPDIRVMKKIINEYFQQVIKEFKRNHLSWAEPHATIILEGCEVNGFVKTRRAKLAEIWGRQKERLFIAPVASFVASYTAIYFNLLRVDELSQELKKTVILTTEAYIGIFMVGIGGLLFSRFKKQFTFSI